MIQFHDTGYGRKFFEYQLPELIKAINNVADNMKPNLETTKTFKVVFRYKKEEFNSTIIASSKDEAIGKFLRLKSFISCDNILECEEVI